MAAPSTTLLIIGASGDLTSRLLLPGIAIKTGPGDGFPNQQVQMEQWNGENYEFVGELIDAASMGE